jgi:tetratricopeptide (TPR) repeat protein
VSPRFETTEDLVRTVQGYLNHQQFDEAQEAITVVESDFAHDPLALHLAGLVWERTYLEQSAQGIHPDLELYERAEGYYRRAVDADPENAEVHGERLFACLFVIGTQRNDPGRMHEGLEIAMKLRDATDDPELAGIYERESAILATGLARLSQDPKDWDLADSLFGKAPEPSAERELYFFHLYRGMVKREVAQRTGDPGALDEAVRSFRRSWSIDTSRGLQYLLADCLLQLDEPGPADLRDAGELVMALTQDSEDDLLLQGLRRRYDIRLKSQGSPAEEKDQ